MYALYVYICIYRYVYHSCSFAVVNPYMKKRDCKVKSEKFDCKIQRTAYHTVNSSDNFTALNCKFCGF